MKALWWVGVGKGVRGWMVGLGQSGGGRGDGEGEGEEKGRLSVGGGVERGLIVARGECIR